KVLPGFFAEALAMAGEHREAGIIFGDVVKADDDGNVMAYFGLSGRKQKTYFTPQSFLDDYLMVAAPGHSLCGATIYRRDGLLEMGGYRDGLGSWVDTFVTRAIGLKYGACYVPKPFMQWRYSPNSLANGTTTWEALRIVRRAARQMRSRQFRACFPEEYVRKWEEDFRTYLLRQHVEQFPRRRDVLFGQAANRTARMMATLDRNERGFVLGLPMRVIPGLKRGLAAAFSQWYASCAEQRLQSDEAYAQRRLDPALRNAGFVRRLAESVPLSAKVPPPLAPATIEPDGGHGYRVDLGAVGVFARSDRESVSMLR